MTHWMSFPPLLTAADAAGPVTTVADPFTIRCRGLLHPSHPKPHVRVTRCEAGCDCWHCEERTGRCTGCCSPAAPPSPAREQPIFPSAQRHTEPHTRERLIHLARAYVLIMKMAF